MMIFKTAKSKLIFTVAGSIIVLCSSLTAMALEIKDGSVSRLIARIGTKVSPETQSQSIPVMAPVETTAQSTNNNQTKSKKSSASSGSQSSGSSNSGSSGSSDSSNNSDSDDAESGDSSNSSPSDPSVPSNIQGNYSATSIESIVNALALVFDDALGDYTDPGGGGPAGGVFDYPPIDQDNVYLGVKDGRLYIKWTLGGTIPSSRETIGDNTIKTVTYNIHVNTDGNPESSDNCGGVETSFQINIAYHDDGQIWYNPWFQANCTNTGPYQTNHDWQFEKTGSGTAHIYNSGLGKNSLVYSYALADLASTINVGAAVKLDISSEAESNNYEHYSYDQNFNNSRHPVWVDWTVQEI